MDIIRHDNPYKPDQEIYKCTIRYTTQYGTLEEVTAWRNDQIKNEAYYKECEELSFKAAGKFYKTLNYKGD